MWVRCSRGLNTLAKTGTSLRSVPLGIEKRVVRSVLTPEVYARWLPGRLTRTREAYAAVQPTRDVEEMHALHGGPEPGVNSQDVVPGGGELELVC